MKRYINKAICIKWYFKRNFKKTSGTIRINMFTVIIFRWWDVWWFEYFTFIFMTNFLHQLCINFVIKCYFEILKKLFYHNKCKFRNKKDKNESSWVHFSRWSQRSALSRSHPNFFICQIELPKFRYCFIMLASYVLQVALQKSVQPIPSLCSKRSPPTCKPSSILLSPSGRATGFAAFIFQYNKMTLEWIQFFTVCKSICPLFFSRDLPLPGLVPHPLVSRSGQYSLEGRLVQKSMVSGARRSVFKLFDHVDNYFYLWNLSIFIWKKGIKE